MVTQYQNGVIGDIPEPQHDTVPYKTALGDCRFDRALDLVWEQIRSLNQYIDEQKPWEVHKQGDADHLREILAYQVSNLLQIADLLVPFMPDTAAKIKHVFEKGVIQPLDGTLFPRKENPSTNL